MHHKLLARLFWFNTISSTIYSFIDISKMSKDSKEIKFFLEVYGVLGDEIQKIVLFETMEPEEIKNALRKAAYAKEDENVELILPPMTNDMSFEYGILSDQVDYRLVVTRKGAGKI